MPGAIRPWFCIPRSCGQIRGRHRPRRGWLSRSRFLHLCASADHPSQDSLQRQSGFWYGSVCPPDRGWHPFACARINIANQSQRAWVSNIIMAAAAMPRYGPVRAGTGLTGLGRPCPFRPVAVDSSVPEKRFALLSNHKIVGLGAASNLSPAYIVSFCATKPSANTISSSSLYDCDVCLALLCTWSSSPRK